MRLHKDITNLEIAELLRSVAASYELKDKIKNKFRIVAYERAADAIEHLSSEAKDVWDEGKLNDIPSVGDSIYKNLDEIFRTGTSKHFQEVLNGLPPAMFELMKVPGIGPRTAYRLCTELRISKSENALSELENAIKKGKIAEIEGFGKLSQSQISKSIEEVKGREHRMLLPYATQIAIEVINWLKKNKNIVAAEPLGSIRRRAATVGDIDIAVASNDTQGALDWFTSYPKSKRTLEKGGKTASIILPGEIQVDMMTQEPSSFGALLQHFTGSKHHNIALREYALKQGLSLSEYGIKKGKILYKFKDEESFYGYLGLKYIPPELREDAGEIEAALDNKIPKLVELKDVKADLQIHSDYDVETSHDLGESSMEEVVKKAERLGYEYIALTEHNPSRGKHTDEQMVDILKRKKDVVDKLNYSYMKTVKTRVRKVFNSLEIDILQNGDLAVPDRALEYIDFGLVSIHSSFKMPKNEATKRVLSALSHPKVKIFAHPTGRELGHREGIELDWPSIFSFCKKSNIWIEINADPIRLDLPDFLVREAVNLEIKLTFGTDAHHVDGLNNMANAVSVARRGWATSKDIINCLPLEEFEKSLKN